MRQLPGCLAIAAVLATYVPSTAQQRPALDALLARGEEQAVAFIQNISTVVAEERYVQTAAGHRRELRSDLLLVRPTGTGDWITFRDVFEVDGVAVRDHSQRLIELFGEKPTSWMERVNEIAKQGARYNLENVGTLDDPFIALSFLQPRYRDRFRYSLGPASKDVGDGVWMVRYEERQRPTLLRKSVGNRDLPASGRYWIDADTGRVLKTELQVGENYPARGLFPSKMTTSFAFDSSLQMIVPTAMEEWHQVLFEEFIGHTTYGNFRRFVVQTEERLK